ncbi:MAG: DUF488 domain-containing protein [Chitinophagaceae bacterium]|nr:MAG: DUF488 domain-containing protein [Chitinophagaceae bacterium]
MKNFVLKRIYEEPSSHDGYRILVDRLWPRGISKEEAKLDEWDKTLAPSTELRKWFNHDPALFDTFSEKYQEELQNYKEELLRIKKIAAKQQVCLLYGAKDALHNQAVVLKQVLEKL